MVQEEKYGKRSLAYSAWHRRLSIARHIGIEDAQLLAMIDLDARLWVEYDDTSKEPLALIELARDVGQDYKSATVTRKLAQRADIPALLVLYTLAEVPNPADEQQLDISQFRIRRLCPKECTVWKTLSPKEYAETLLEVRRWQAKRLDLEWREKLAKAANSSTKDS